jgi:hypothetical protein
MCNQTEMYRDMMDYDERANRGEVHIRGIAHNSRSCPKCLRDARKLRSRKPKRKAN